MGILSTRVLTSLDAGVATVTLNDAATDNALGEEMVPELMRAISPNIARCHVLGSIASALLLRQSLGYLAQFAQGFFIS